jgi:hypothetical protein
MKRWGAFLLIIFLTACTPRASRGKDGRVFLHVVPTPVARVELNLAAGTTTTFETANPTFGCAPVLHLWDVAARRELTRDAACAWPGCSARIQYRNSGPTAQRLLLIAHARDDRGSGTLDLLRDGELLQRAVRVAGTQLAVAHGAGYVYQAAAEPLGARHASVYALDRDGKLLALDDDGGPLGLPRLAAGAGVRRLIVASDRQERGSAAVRVYANDGLDADHDGLGSALERALGTCDGADDRRCARSPLAGYYRAVPLATADSDRDGLDDGDELLGVGAARRLDLPRWGSDPRHKNVFVEVDYTRDLGPGAFSPDDFSAVQALFARGSAQSLRNPDGQPGVRVHLDVGLQPRTRAQAALFGDWGGSGVARNDYKKARQRDFARERRNYFRYALLTRTGTGQASGDAFTINRDLARAPLFAHELGHTLGLRHHGDDAWGEINCKPNYASVMNYSYQNRQDVGFSSRADLMLDPSHMLERAPVSAKLRKLLAGSPIELDVIPDAGIDWNRDGVIEREPVRAAATWATYKSCEANSAGRSTLAKDTGNATPSLLRLGARLAALWLDPQGRLWTRSSLHSGPDGHGSCPLGDGARTACAEWSAAAQLAVGAGLRAVASLPLSESRAALALVAAGGHVQLTELTLADATTGAVALGPLRQVAAITTDRPPSLVSMTVDPAFYGASEIVSVLVRAAPAAAEPIAPAGTATGTLLQASATSLDGPFDVRPLLDQNGRPLISPFAPSALRLGTGETCAAIADAERYLHLYCYVVENDRWLDLSTRAFDSALGPQTGSEPALAFHRYRDANGDMLRGDDSFGALYLAFTEPASGTVAPADNPGLFISEWLDADHGARSRLHLRWRGALSDQWAHLADDTSVAFYEDEDLSALKAAFIAKVAGGLQLDWLPLADGSFTARLQSGDDFAVMERGICVGLKGIERCGDPRTAH